MISYPFKNYSRILIKAIDNNIEDSYSIKFFNYLMSDFENNIGKSNSTTINTKILRGVSKDYDTFESFMYICPILLRGVSKFIDLSVGRSYVNRSDLILHLHFERDIFEIFATSIEKDKYNMVKVDLDNITNYFNSVKLKISRQEKIESLYI